MSEQTPITSVKLDGPDPRPRQAYEAFLRASNAPVPIPDGKVSKDMLTDIAQENVGLAFNRITQIASTGDDKIALQAAREVLDRAHGKVSGDQASVNINMMPTRIELVVVPLAGQTAPEPITIDVDQTKVKET